MKNDKHSYQETARQKSQRHGEPIRNGEAQVNQVPQPGIRHQGVEDLPNPSPERRFLIARDNGLPAGGSFGWVVRRGKPVTVGSTHLYIMAFRELSSDALRHNGLNRVL